MGLMKKYREKHPKKVDPFDAEAARLHKYMADLDVGTAEYEKAQNQLAKVYQTQGTAKENKRKLTKEGKATLWVKIVGGLGTLAGIGALGYYEMKGNTFSGEKRKLADGLANLVTNLLKNKG